jgi:phage regulator Rha-like protein
MTGMGLVFVKGTELFTSSSEIAKGVGHTHASVVKMINSAGDLEIFSALKAEKIHTKGRPSDVFNLNEEQATLLIALMRNTPVVRQFKQTLVREFFKQRRFIARVAADKNSASYLLIRDESKEVRLEETDWIKVFVNYAVSQGSKNSMRYYSNISTMENKALFFLDQKVKNVRELLDMRQLSIIKVADLAVIEAIKEGIEQGLHYKLIFNLMKERVETISKILPKSPVAYLLSNQKEAS